jgi:ketopantoate hydroxymethyltransferase
MEDASSIHDAIEMYVKSVKSGSFPAKEHTFY